MLKTNKDIAFCLIDSDGKVVEDFLKMDMALTMGREFGFYKARDKVFYFSSMRQTVSGDTIFFPGKDREFPYPNFRIRFL